MKNLKLTLAIVMALICQTSVYTMNDGDTEMTDAYEMTNAHTMYNANSFVQQNLNQQYQITLIQHQLAQHTLMHQARMYSMMNQNVVPTSFIHQGWDQQHHHQIAPFAQQAQMSQTPTYQDPIHQAPIYSMTNQNAPPQSVVHQGWNQQAQAEHIARQVALIEAQKQQQAHEQAAQQKAQQEERSHQDFIQAQAQQKAGNGQQNIQFLHFLEQQNRQSNQVYETAQQLLKKLHPTIPDRIPFDKLYEKLVSPPKLELSKLALTNNTQKSLKVTSFEITPYPTQPSTPAPFCKPPPPPPDKQTSQPVT